MIRIALLVALAAVAPASVFAADEVENSRKVAEANPKEPNAWFNYAVRALEAGKFEAAKGAAKKACELDATASENWNLLATAAFQGGDLEGADAAWVKSLQLSEKQDDVQYNLGVVRQQRAEKMGWTGASTPIPGRTPVGPEAMMAQAIQAYRKTLQLKPGHEGALMNLGVISHRRGNFADAMGQYQALLASNPERRTAVLVRLATAALRKYEMDPVPNVDDLDTCIESLEQAEAQETPTADRVYTQGVANYRRGYFEKALAAFRRAREMSPSLYDALYNEGVCLYDMQRYDDAREVFVRCLKKNPGDAQAELNRTVAYEEGVKYHLKRGTTLFIRGNIAGATHEWNRVLASEPNHRTAKDFVAKAREKFAAELERHAAEAESHQKAGRMKEAATEWEASLKMLAELDEAGVAGALMERGAVAKANARAKAGRDATKGQLAKTEEVGRRLEEAIALEERGDVSGALKGYTGVLEFEPSHAGAKTRRTALLGQVEKEAKTRLEAGKTFGRGDADLVRAENELDLAVKAIEDVPELKATRETVQNELNRVRARKRELAVRLLDDARSLRAGGKPDQARERYRRVLAMNPDDPGANQGMRELSGQAKSAEKISAEQARTLYMDGVSLYVAGKPKSAVKNWERLLAAEPNHPDAVQSTAKVKAEIEALEKRGIKVAE